MNRELPRRCDYRGRLHAARTAPSRMGQPTLTKARGRTLAADGTGFRPAAVVEAVYRIGGRTRTADPRRPVLLASLDCESGRAPDTDSLEGSPSQAKYTHSVSCGIAQYGPFLLNPGMIPFSIFERSSDSSIFKYFEAFSKVKYLFIIILWSGF